MNKEDSEILDLIKNDPDFELGFKALVQKYQKPLYWHIRRMVHIHEDADDIVQNVFIKVYKSIKGFRAEAKLYTWLYRIASNESISFLRKKKYSSELNFEIKLKQDPFFEGNEIQILVKKAIESLPIKQKQVFILRYYDELPYKEMAEILNTSIGALKASYHHAAKKIEAYIKTNNVYS